MKLLGFLKLPQTKNIKDLDDPAATMLHAEIVRSKGFLKNLYNDFYSEIIFNLGDTENKTIVELGSGGGFMKELLPELITSDVLDLPNIDMNFSACEMPFDDGEIDAIVMVDVLHHIPNTKNFFSEALRCLCDLGKIVMIEPANTVWSRFIYQNFHHESFDPNGGWSLDGTGPLSNANGALPWIIFHRDRDIFEREFARLKIENIRLHTPISYLLSGGLSFRQLAPSFTFRFIRSIEWLISFMNPLVAMFETITLEKI